MSNLYIKGPSLFTSTINFNHGLLSKLELACAYSITNIEKSDNMVPLKVIIKNEIS